jgi:choline-glycine betaine transporter
MISDLTLEIIDKEARLTNLKAVKDCSLAFLLRCKELRLLPEEVIISALIFMALILLIYQAVHKSSRQISKESRRTRTTRKGSRPDERVENSSL